MRLAVNSDLIAHISSAFMNSERSPLLIASFASLIIFFSSSVNTESSTRPAKTPLIYELAKRLELLKFTDKSAELSGSIIAESEKQG